MSPQHKAPTDQAEATPRLGYWGKTESLSSHYHPECHDCHIYISHTKITCISSATTRHLSYTQLQQTTRSIHICFMSLAYALC
jgi:hypothetical protein